MLEAREAQDGCGEMAEDGEGVGFVFREGFGEDDGDVGVIGRDDGDGGSQDAGEEAGEGLGYGGG